MKKLILILMTVSLLAGLAACGQQETAVTIVTPEPVTSQTTEQQPAQAAVAVPTVAPVTAAEQSEQTEQSGDDAGQVSRGNGSGTTTTTNTNSGNSNSGDALTIAQSYIGSSLSSLIAAIGSPSSQEYVVSCDENASQEGMLYYPGFMVWTIQYNDGTEIVKGVS